MQTGTMRLRELTVRYSVRKDGEGQPVVVGRDLSNPRETAASLMTMLQDEPSEVFAILCVTTKYRVIAYHEVSRGTLDATLVHPREVFKVALLANAAAIILTHYVARHIMTVYVSGCVMWPDRRKPHQGNRFRKKQPQKVRALKKRSLSWRQQTPKGKHQSWKSVPPPPGAHSGARAWAGP